MRKKYFILPILFSLYLAVFFYFLPLKSEVYETKNFYTLEDESRGDATDLLNSPAEPDEIQSDIKESDNLSEEVSIKAGRVDTAEEEVKFPKDILLDVPFIPQAPFGEWANPIYQDGCEEAVSLMAVSWAQGKKLTKEEAKEEIIKIAEYQKENFGDYRDTSAQDTVVRIIQGYFGYEQAEVKRDITPEDIIRELSRGNLVITPMNGQKLNNPYYTPPGPERHMLVIRGYDSKTKEFITNDAGTKRGELYRYKEEALYNAIRDYLTGYHLPTAEEEKVMIIVKQSQI